MSKFLLNPFDEADRLAKGRGKWIVATVLPKMSWPTRKQVVTYEGKDYLLLPESSDDNAGIAINVDQYGLDSKEARRLIMRFCSALCWSESKGIEIVAWIGGSNPNPLNIKRGRMIVDYLDTEHIPSVESDEGKAALALYREGLSLDNPFYSFLSLYKSISVVFPKGIERKNWIDATLENLDNRDAIKRRDQLLEEKTDIGQYIWDEGRNAIAHAEREPYVNPDEVDDHYRLHNDLSLLKNIAELAIEEKIGIQRSHTIWKEHLYELKGFRELIPDEILKRLRESEPLEEGTTVDLPERYTLIARKGAEKYIIEDMLAEVDGQVQGGLVFDFVTRDGAIRIRTVLNFLEERLNFEPMGGVGFTANRDDTKHIEYEILLLEFQRCVFGNGHLEIWDPETETMLSRSDTYLPVNCFLNNEFYESEIAKLKALLADKKADK